MKNRELILKLNKAINFALAALLLIYIAALFIPFFEIDGQKVSILIYLGWPSRYETMETLMNVKFLNIATLKYPLLGIVLAIFGIIFCLRKSGLGTMLFPLAFGIIEVIGYASDAFLKLGPQTGVSAGYIVQFIIAIVVLVATLFGIYLGIMEILTRTKDDFMDWDAASSM